MMIVIGITGQMAMGKSTVAHMLGQGKTPIFSADQQVHRLYRENEYLLDTLKRVLPEIFVNHVLDKRLLRRAILRDPSILERLNSLIHSLLYDQCRFDIQFYRLRGYRVLILDIPLLFETHFSALCDAIIVVSAPPWVQRARIARRGTSKSLVRFLLSRQMTVWQQKLHADFIVETGLSKALTWRQINFIKDVVMS